MLNFSFYLLSTLALLSGSLLGFYTGLYLIYDLLVKTYGAVRGEDELILAFVNAVSAVLGFIIGIAIALIFIHWLGRRWGSRLSFGSHPVLKLTLLSFLTFLGLLVLLLFLIPTK